MSTSDEQNVVDEITGHGAESTDPAGDLGRQRDAEREDDATDEAGATGADGGAGHSVTDSPKD